MKITGSSRVVLLPAILLALLVCNVCTRHSESSATPFPASSELAGWVKSGETRTFSATELWSYIDGDAERYVKAGIKTTSTSDYKFEDKFEAVADVYEMGSAAGAQAIFDSETASGSQLLQLGIAGKLYSGSLVFRKGRYLVRIVAYKEGADVQRALQELGREIERRLTA
jgi:hypothetical protein